MFRLGKVLFLGVFLFATVCYSAEIPLVVGTTIPPQKYFLEQIGKERIKVITLIPPNADPHTYEPKPEEVKGLKDAKAYFAIGNLEIELIWLERIKKLFPNMKVFSTVEGIKLREGEKHSHHGKMEGADPHVWLSPSFVMLSSRTICKYLMEIDPEGTEIYEKNYKEWISRLVALDIEILKLLSPYRGKKFLIYHPAWGYFADAYGLTQIPVEKEGKPPGPGDLKSIISFIKENNIKTLFVTSPTAPTEAKKLADNLKLKLVTIDPLVYEWDKNLKDVTNLLIESFKDE